MFFSLEIKTKTSTSTPSSLLEKSFFPNDFQDLSYVTFDGHVAFLIDPV